MEEEDPDIGDSFEGIRTLPVNLLPILPTDQDKPKSELLGEFASSSIPIDLKLRIPEVERSVLLCTTALNIGALESLGVEEQRYLARFGKQYIEFLSRHTNDFTEGYGVIFPQEEMERKLKAFADSKGLAYVSGHVEYGDPQLSEKDLIELRQGYPAVYKFLFHKRRDYGDQYEYRFALLPLPGESSSTLDNSLDERGFLTIETEPFENYELIYFQE